MTVTEAELDDMWDAAMALRRGPARFAALDAVLRHADAADLPRVAYELRMAATNEFHHGGDPTRAFLAFSRCLAAHDRDPGIGPEWSLLWNFKWIVWALPQFPHVPLDRTRAVLDDMSARYHRGGWSQHAVHQHRWLVAHHVGDPAADDWMRELRTAPTDRLSDCAHCVPSCVVRHLVSRGRDDEAIEVGAPYTRGGCSEQPRWMLSELLLAYVRTGALDLAADAHRRAYRAMRDDPHHLDNIAQHVFLCGVTGNELHGLELVERHLPWLDAPSSPFAAMEFAAGAGLVLARLVAAGYGDLPLRPAPGAEPRTIGQACDDVTTLARETAAAFDARNGNTHQSGRVHARLVAEPIVDRLDLTAADEPRRRGRARP